MRAIVFGGSGFVGSHVADALSEAGYEVRVFDLRPSPYVRSGQEMVIGNILDAEQVSKATQGCDYVYNFAGVADLDGATTKPHDTVLLNIVGNTHILESAVRSNCKRFIYASTIYVYSQLGGFYRCSKQSSELYIEEYQRRYSLDFTILRYGTLYGPRADLRNSVYNYLYQALTEGCIKCSGTGEELREYIHVKDAARLSVEILADEYRNKHFILTGHYPIKFKNLLQMIQEILGREIKLEIGSAANPNHYNITPYSFIPKIGYKLTSNRYIEMGQGLIECLGEIHEKETLNKGKPGKEEKGVERIQKLYGTPIRFNGEDV